MTPGHQHRTIALRRDGLLHRALTRPLWRTTNLSRVEASPYPYGVLIDGDRIADGELAKVPDPREVYYLSTLGILHRWTGLSVWIAKDPA